MRYDIQKMLTVVFVLVFGCACDSLFEDELPEYDLTAENAIIDEISSESALLGVYSFLAERVFDSYYIADNAIRSGLVTNKYGTYAENLTLLRVPANSLENRDKWSIAYQMINAANNVIHYVQRLEDAKFKGNRKTEIIAEARFLRAFAHMFLMKYYAYFWDVNSPYGVLIRTKPGSLAENAKSRLSMRESFAQMIEDLDFAAEHAPDYISCLRASKGAAKAFKAFLLIVRGEGQDYADAASLAQEVIDQGGFEMEENFADIFKKDYNSKEVIFSRALSSKVYSVADTRTESMKRTFGGVIDYTGYLLAATGLMRDKRYTETLEYRMYEAASTDKESLIWKKVWRENGNCPMFYMRLAQMYLIRAEGLARSGATAEEVVDVLNVLRLRSGNTELNAADYPTQDDLLTAVYKEIMCEVCCENDSEWFTVIRFKSTKTGGRKLGDFNVNYVDDILLAFPIAEEEMKNNPAMVDNPA